MVSSGHILYKMCTFQKQNRIDAGATKQNQPNFIAKFMSVQNYDCHFEKSANV